MLALFDRAESLHAFLDRAGWNRATVEPLAGDASFRRYFRVAANGGRSVLMDAPPDREDVRPFARIARHLRALGFSAPEILAADEDEGFLLLEDFGDDTFTRALAHGADEHGLYQLAIEVLIRLHTIPPMQALPPGLPAYDMRRLLDEALLLIDWYLPAVTGKPVAEEAYAAYVAAWSEVLPLVLEQPSALVLRDFHVDNLMRLSGRAGIAGCGLLDFQDAVEGAAAYDVMSLLEDARRDISPALKAFMLDRYINATRPEDVRAFHAVFAILAAQRHAKVIGIFTRLWKRDGKPSYLVHVPRVWRLLEAALAHPVLAPVGDWFAREVPAAHRRIP